MPSVQDQDHRRIVINSMPLFSNLTGVGQVTSEIAKRLESLSGYSVDFYTPLKTYSSLEALRGGDSHAKLLTMAKRIFSRIPFRDQLRNRYTSASSCGGEQYRLYWEPNYIPVDSIRSERLVTTVYDMSVFDHPEWHPPDRVAYSNQNFFQKIGRSDVVTTISEFSKQRFLDSQKEIKEDRVRIMPCGINHDVFRVLDQEKVEFFRAKHSLPENFILFVGTVEPRKNLLHLLTAYERLPLECRDAFPRVLVGDIGWENKEIFKRIKQLGRTVVQMGYMQSQQDLALMYNAASVFVFPSLYEGFGIPPLESMACGTPVCLSSIPVFHEIYGTDDVCYGDPVDVESFTHALQSVLTDSIYREQLASRGFELAQKYTWDDAYEQYATVFKEVAGR